MTLSLTHWLSEWRFDNYNDFNDDDDYNDYGDRDLDFDLDWEQFSELVT